MIDLETYREKGREFHRILQDAKRAAGSQLHVHEDHDEHDIAVGMALALVQAGRAEHGVEMYNAWAEPNGYMQVKLVQPDPPIVDVIDGLVRITPDGMDVVECR